MSGRNVDLATLTEYQKLALKQFDILESEKSIDVEVIDAQIESGILKIEISLNCESIDNISERFTLNQRERFIIKISRDYPFIIPEVWVVNKTWFSLDHVQFNGKICLLYNSDLEWNISVGIIRLIRVLYKWIKQCAQDNLDPVQFPEHPLVAYSYLNSERVIVLKNIRNIKIGEYCKAQFKIKNNNIYIDKWLDDKVFYNHNNCDVLFLRRKLDFELPQNYTKFIIRLEMEGYNVIERFLNLFRNELYRGELYQYLILINPLSNNSIDIKMCRIYKWAFLDIHFFNQLKDTLRIIPLKIPYSIESRLVETDLIWCKVYDMRPELVKPRDMDSPMEIFKDKKIAVWGCGALGSVVAEIVARAKCSELLLIDNDYVTPGILVRQMFNEADIGKGKSEVLAKKLNNIFDHYHKQEIVFKIDNLQNYLNTNDYRHYDYIIDCTASNLVQYRVDLIKSDNSNKFPTYISLSVNQNAQKGYAIIIPSKMNIQPEYLKRQTISSLHSDIKNYHLLDDFYPKNTEEKFKFEPEPGCSMPTFQGSAADTFSLASTMLNITAKAIQQESDQNVFFYTSPISGDFNPKESNMFINYTIEEPNIFSDSDNNSKFIVYKAVWNEFIDNVEKLYADGNPNETGGYFLGSYNAITKIFYIDKFCFAPEDSTCEVGAFIRGKEGINEEIQKHNEIFPDDSLIGEWHTHPNSSANPSQTDNETMNRIITDANIITSGLLIIGRINNEVEIKFHTYEYKNEE